MTSSICRFCESLSWKLFSLKTPKNAPTVARNSCSLWAESCPWKILIMRASRTLGNSLGNLALDELDDDDEDENEKRALVHPSAGRNAEVVLLVIDCRSVGLESVDACTFGPPPAPGVVAGALDAVLVDAAAPAASPPPVWIACESTATLRAYE